MQEKQVKTVELENGYKVDFFDASRRIAKDTFIVIMVARMEVEVGSALFEDTVRVDDIRKLLGETVVYEVKNERTFVKDDEKETVFEDLMTNFISNTLQYLSHKEFPGKMILKKFNDSSR